MKSNLLTSFSAEDIRDQILNKAVETNALRLGVCLLVGP